MFFFRKLKVNKGNRVALRQEGRAKRVCSSVIACPGSECSKGISSAHGKVELLRDCIANR